MACARRAVECGGLGCEWWALLWLVTRWLVLACRGLGALTADVGGLHNLQKGNNRC